MMLEKELKEETNKIFYYAVFLEDYYSKKMESSEDLDYDARKRYKEYNNTVKKLNKAINEDIRDRFDEEDLYNPKEDESKIGKKLNKMRKCIRQIFKK